MFCPLLFVMVMVSGSGCTATVISPIFFVTALLRLRKLISGGEYSRSASAGVSGKSLVKLIGFKVTRMLAAPALRISSCAGLFAAVIS